MTFKEFKETETFNLIGKLVIRRWCKNSDAESKIIKSGVNVDNWIIKFIDTDTIDGIPYVAIYVQPPYDFQLEKIQNLTYKKFCEMGLGSLFPNGFDIKDIDIDEDDPDSYIESGTDVSDWRVVQIGCGWDKYNDVFDIPIIFVKRPESEE